MARAFSISLVAAAVMVAGGMARGQDGAIGPFSDHADIGAPSSPGPGSEAYDAAKKTLTVSGGGANIWANADAFHLVWKKASGDVSFAANIAFAAPTAGAIEHRKAVLMIRQSLDPGAAYADACVHGNGMTALQWRDTKDAITYEVQANANGPSRLRVEKRGDYFSMSIGSSDADLHPAGGACKVVLIGDYYIGIGVCSHEASRVEQATFSDISLTPIAAAAPSRTSMISTLQTLQLSSKDRRTVYVISQRGNTRAEAPNWFPDNSNTLYYNNGGKLFKISAVLPSSSPPAKDAVPAAPAAVDLGMLTNINNDHGISPDGQWLAISDQSQTQDRQSRIYTMALSGQAAPKRLTENAPSYFHGWSPDGKTIAYCAQRNGKFDIYTMPAAGGAETRLTTADGKSDGPEYSPDGQYIYFNSDRTGLMQIWRMHPDGSNQEQLTKDDANNWFPHISPNGQQMVFLTYDKSVKDHPENQDVTLRIMNVRNGQVSVLATLFGGQGTMNVPSWSPNSQYLAFMSYQIVPQ